MGISNQIARKTLQNSCFYLIDIENMTCILFFLSYLPPSTVVDKANIVVIVPCERLKTFIDIDGCIDVVMMTQISKNSAERKTKIFCTIFQRSIDWQQPGHHIDIINPGFWQIGPKSTEKSSAVQRVVFGVAL